MVATQCSCARRRSSSARTARGEKKEAGFGLEFPANCCSNRLGYVTGAHTAASLCVRTLLAPSLDSAAKMELSQKQIFVAIGVLLVAAPLVAAILMVPHLLDVHL